MTSLEATRSLPEDLRLPEQAPAPRTAPRVLRVCGTRRSLLRLAHDLGRAVGMAVVEVEPSGLAAALGPGRRPDDVVLLDAETALEHAQSGPSRSRPGEDPQAGAAVVAGFLGGADPWAAATALGRNGLRTDVVVLPAGRKWLADHLETGGRGSPVHPLLGVVGACGGVGTSSASLWLGAALAERGADPVVVDAVEGSCGLDAAAAPEVRPGLRWEDLALLPHLPEGEQVLAALPSPHGLPVLTSSPTGVSGAEGQGTERSLRRGDVGAVLRSAGTPVVDLGSFSAVEGSSLEEQWLPQASALVLLVPFTLRGLCQGRAAVARWSDRLPVHAVGVRSRLVDLSDADVSRALGTPLVATLPELRAVYGASESGHLLEVGHRKALRVPLATILEAALPAVPRAQSVRGAGAAVLPGRTARAVGDQFAALRGSAPHPEREQEPSLASPAAGGLPDSAWSARSRA